MRKALTVLFIIYIGVFIAICGCSKKSKLDETNENLFLICMELMSGIHKSQELYLDNDGRYAAMFDYLAPYYIQGCEMYDGKDCPDMVERELSSYCIDPTIVRTEEGFNYKITAYGMDKYGCPICVTKNGVYPEKYSECEGLYTPICP